MIAAVKRTAATICFIIGFLPQALSDSRTDEREQDSAVLRSRAVVLLPDALTSAANRPVVTILAGKRTVRHSRSRIRSAIAHGLIACVIPTEILLYLRLSVVDAGG